MDTARLQTQLYQMEEITKNQRDRQATMEGAENDLATALAKELQQLETQTDRHNELLGIHHTCLDDILNRSQGFNDSQKALEMTADALIAQRERDTEQYTQRMQTLYQRTSDHDHMLLGRRVQEEHSCYADQMRRTEMQMITERLQQMEQQLRFQEAIPIDPSDPAIPMAGKPPSMDGTGQGGQSGDRSMGSHRQEIMVLILDQMQPIHC